MEQVPKSEAAESLERAFAAVRTSGGTPTFQRMDDERFAALMERWLTNGGTRKIADALSRSSRNAHDDLRPTVMEHIVRFPPAAFQ